MWELTAMQRDILCKVTKIMDTPGNDFMSKTMIPLITQETGVSLRSLDWLVTNFSKKYPVILGGNYNVHLGYKDMLNRFRRRNFDPFRRSIGSHPDSMRGSDSTEVGRVRFTYNDKLYHTTIGQLNFIMWVHKNGVLDYAQDNINEIETDMTETIMNKSTKCEFSLPKRKRELSKAVNCRCLITRNRFTMNF